MIKREYKIIGRLSRIFHTYIIDYNKHELRFWYTFKRMVSCFFDNPRCMCYTNISCQIHNNEEK